MPTKKKIVNALISVYYKEGLDDVAIALSDLGVNVYSTGGTQKFLETLNIKVNAVEDLTGYPSILGGRVKTLHPKVFGGILARRDNEKDCNEIEEYSIPFFDLVIVDLYPFEETLKNTSEESEIIEKIDVGGVSLIRAAAKNYKDTLVVADKNDFCTLVDILRLQDCCSSIDQRRDFAAKAFHITSHYDSLIYNYFDKEESRAFKLSFEQKTNLRYGENPHQKGVFYGKLNQVIEHLHGKELSYNNLLDIDAAINLIEDFDDSTMAIIKHNNPCGVASREILAEAWSAALAGDPVSAFGGIVVSNRKIDIETAIDIDKIFIEVLVAPDYDDEALRILTSKKNRIIIKQKAKIGSSGQFRNVLNGVLSQDKDQKLISHEDLKPVTKNACSSHQLDDLIFADKIVKNAKSNTIVLAKNKQLIGIGCGQTSRIDALKQAISKALEFKFDLKNSVMGSDAFFPFPDCVEIAGNAGVAAVVQPGGSVKDNESISYCDKHGIAMFFTGVRHFKH